MKKGRHLKTLGLSLMIGTLLFSTMANAAGTTKNLKAVYNNIKIVYNGTTKTLSSDKQPFIVNDTTYVPLRAISEILGAEVGWANNTVSITNDSVTSNDLALQIADKNIQIASLTQQLKIATDKLAAYDGTGTGGTNLGSEAIKATLTKITNTYDEDYDVDWDIKLSLVSGRLDLSVYYNSRYDEKAFNKISESKLKQFIKEMCYDIAQLHQDVEIRGTIEDSYKDTEKAEFRYTKSGSYTFELTSTFSLKEFAEELEDDYREINYIGFNIPVSYIDLSENSRGDTLTFKITVNLKPDGQTSYVDSWNKLTDSNKRDLKSYLFEKMKKQIENEYDNYDYIEGYIYDSSTSTKICDYIDGSVYLNNNVR